MVEFFVESNRIQFRQEEKEFVKGCLVADSF